MEKANCPLCNAVGSKLFTLHSGANIAKCEHCSFYFRVERDPLSFETAYLTRGFHFDTDLQEYDRTHAAIFANYLARLRKGSLLDIGCARGTLLRVAEANGFSPLFGIEPSISDANKLACKYPSWKISNQIQKSNIADNSIDNITAIDVLEHITFLTEELSLIYKKLRKGGQFLAVTGNIDSDCAMKQKETWEYFYTPGHINFFSPKTIKNKLSSLGFKNIKIQCSFDGITGRHTNSIDKASFDKRFQVPSSHSNMNKSDYFNEFDLSLAAPQRLSLQIKLTLHFAAKVFCSKKYYRGNGMLIVATKP